MTEASLFNLQHGDEASTGASDRADGSSPARAQPAAFTHAGAQSLSLYRKYRPQSFASDDLFGQEHIVNTLRNAIALNRIAHAYLFCGPRGTGKTTTARLLAKAVNCLDPDPRNRPCNQCSACDAINRNATTDVIEIDAASNRGIDDIRDLRERVKYAPTQMATKFYIIDEAHQITGAAANAFLKTLEEPPSHTKFVLATTDPEELLPTIVSRCQRFDFRRINMEAMIACLIKVSTVEGIAIDDDALQIIARHATGSMRDALGLLDQVAVYRENVEVEEERITAMTVRTVLGVSRNERVEKLVTALAERDASAGLIAINEASDAGDDIRQLGRQLVAYFRILLLQRAGGSADADDTARELAARFSLQELADLAGLFADIDYKTRHATFPQLPLEIAIVEGSHRGQQLPAAPAMEATSEARRESRSAPAQTSNASDEGYGAVDAGASQMAPPTRPSLRDRVRGDAQPTRSINERAASAGDASRLPDMSRERPVAQPSVAPSTDGPISPAFTLPPPLAEGGTLSLELIVELWSKIRADVKSVNRRIEALLQQVDPVTINGEVVVLASPYEFHRNRVNSDEARHVIEDVISRLVQRRVRISCVTREEASQLVGASGPAKTVEEAGSPTKPAVDSGLDLAEPPAVQPPTADDGGTPVEEAGAMASVVPSSDIADSPSTVSSIEDDERRIQAVKNIFDAEEADD